MAAAVKGTAATTRLRKAECCMCGCIVRMSRSAMASAGVPFCGCGAGRMHVPDLGDAFSVLPDEQLYEHPEFRELAELEQRRAIREARKANGKGTVGQCGGCRKPLTATNEACMCGFSNDVRGHRNLGRYVEGAAFCKEARAEQEWPF